MSRTDNSKIGIDPPVVPADPRMQKGAAKTARIPIKIAPQTAVARKPAWIRAKSPTHPEVGRLKGLLRAHRPELDQLMAMLLEQETVDGDAVYRLIGGPAPAAVEVSPVAAAAR